MALVCMFRFARCGSFLGVGLKLQRRDGWEREEEGKQKREMIFCGKFVIN